MSNFTSDLSLRWTYTNKRGQRLYRVNRPLIYEIGHEGSGLKIKVPEGYVTNLASVPRPFNLLFPSMCKFYGKYIASTVLHDYMTNEMFDESLPVKSGFSRRIADAIFDESMAVLGVPIIQRRIFYAGVRLWARAKEAWQEIARHA